jgi:flavin reductase (DIM6/NTAB) family NADH-FMN oxidoreductase RutF
MWWHNGCPIVGGAIAWFVCRKWAAYGGGDHTIFVGRALAHTDVAGPQ